MYRTLADERVRLLWDSLPVWFGMRRLSALLAGNVFNVVCSSYAGARADPRGWSGEQAGHRLQAFMESFA